ncbi:hypothetical protein Poly30_39850 [Planctomycetes bacterium Poly30]|uniref:Uncharacterized protein n=2 Tax=Saltatorellus ferox TaxID=2528018 RepID=A0A518EWH6_9BACT|nr:hypothetical protein Poly30_39850 [Planctomycetes bacterium Poly30]
MIELSVSVAVLVTVLLASMQGNLSAQRLSSDAIETQRAVRVMEAARALLEDADVADVADVGGAVEPGLALNLVGVLDGQSVVYSLPDWVPGTPVPSPLGVRLTLTWTSGLGQARSYSVLDAVR